MDYSIDEQMVVCISRQVEDGEILAQGIATPLVMAGYILAVATHAPNAVFASAIGQGLCYGWGPLGVATIENIALGNAVLTMGFVSIAVDVLPIIRPKEFFRPAQIDAAGNFNNIAIGKNYRQPRLRLPGTGGIPDVSVKSNDTCFYVPRHSRVTFVEQVDFVSGMGYHPARTRGSGPIYLVTDLGQFDWHEGRMRLTTYHPGVTIEQIQRKTGFELLIADDVRETEPPTADELSLLREEIDPLGVRTLETLSGSARRDLLREILRKEAATYNSVSNSARG